MTEEDFELVRGSGNVFRDFGDPNGDLEAGKGYPRGQDHSCAG